MDFHARTRRVVAVVTLAIVTGLAVFSLAPPAQATIVVALSRADLVQKSDVVVRATVVGRTSEWSADKTQILTHTRLKVTTWIKGTGAQDLVLEQIGGTVDGVTSRVDGDATLATGEDVVLLLRVQGKNVYLTALALAAYHVDTPKSGPQTVHRDLKGLSFAQLVAGKYVVTAAPIELAETLEHLLADLSNLARPVK